MGLVTTRRPVLRISAEGRVHRPDTLAGEEPLELRVGGRPLAVTMRTPGHDLELAHGFLLTEAVVTRRTDVARAYFCDSTDATGRNTYNVLDLVLAAGVPDPAPGVERAFYTTSSCGVCGKASLDAIRARTRYPPGADPLRISAGTLSTLPAALRAAQRVFDSTGGLHAAALFTRSGDLLVAREDVGRHNAVDKTIGWAVLQDRVPLTGCILLVSGRASFELTQKVVMAGIPVLAAVSAPSSLAVDLAEEAGITLVGFLRGPSMNVYTGAERITEAATGRD
ncbi:MAG: formate dehydrogenase accessory sulfurtransferase FdhD [Pseudonocardiaceae bacterium]